MILFVGAGPGDPELITVKGQRALREADLVLYAGSLVPTALLQWAKPDAACRDSAGMHLEEQIALMAEAHAAGKSVVRLHTGDPSLYGAIGEQMAALDRLGIPYRVIPGVSSFLAAAAALPAELTLPGVSQTVIITRCAGRTPVPPGEDLAVLASHRATMAIFLSAGRLDETIAALARHYPPDTPAAVVQRASWPEQKIVRGTLATIVARAAGIERTAMILVGEALANEGEASKLYDRTFSHGYREGQE
ncbi:MAG TPA: precorrin-4 C(11)-methyltransferase [Armatimonadota bacterium]|nr:precorrin-4 C(11)-methyltransferase [Armatimonadota bacterium]HOS42845.1 precorrin-4 C(11)-methyltransferase [Armatimonadota bacterium]